MKIIKKISILTLGIIISFSSCKTSDVSYNVININDAAGIRNHAIMYFLPKTVIKTEIKLKKIVYKSGPFAAYAKRYLDIDNAFLKDEVKWEVEDINFFTYPIADTSQIYLIEHEEIFEDIDVQFNSLGIIRNYNSNIYDNENLFVDFKTDKQNLKANNFFTESTNRFLSKSEEINFDDVELPKQVVNEKSLSEKAKELAAKILTLREDRAATLVGDGYTEIVPEGGALAIMVENINRIEKEYLSFFIGKKAEETFIYNYDFIPQETREITQKILFRFSSTQGIVENNDMSGIPVIIELDAFRNLNQIKSFDKTQNHLKRVSKIKEQKKGLYYRIPDMVKVKLLINDNVLSEKNILVSQFGLIQNLPAKYLNGNYSIEFDSEFGSIFRIDKLKENIKK
ncbi:MAG: DUF4831 family protein [Bacteroidales bacterium]|nr:DUF4831 family protein [Bacteroidales bacterium]MBN2755630.1 DUF4831 family protein [Bacteroidales bacterium]